MNRVLLACVFSLSAMLIAPAASLGQGLLINEFMADNNSTVADQDGDYSDWIEIHNPTAAAVNLDGWHLTDEADNLDKWRFPAVTIPAGGYLVVFASGKDRAVAGNELHTDFKLSADGEYLALVRADGLTIVHEFAPSFPRQQEDVSYGLGLAVTTEETWIATGATARALVPADGADEATWMLPAYDDSAWLSGPTGVGYDEAETYRPLIGLDVNEEMNGINSSVWIRVPFTVADPAGVLSLTLRMKFEDGFVAYLNGQTVAGGNLDVPLSSAPLAWNAGVSSWYDETAAQTFEDFNISAYASALVAGENILAIHGLNAGAGSSDMLIVPELVAGIDPGGQTAELRYFTAPTPGQANATGVLGLLDEVGFSVERGFFDAPFVLYLTSETPDVQIRYTTDGTEPTTSHGTLYDGAAIPITTTTVVRAMASKSGYIAAAPVSHTYIFLADVLNQDDDESARGFPATWYAGWSSSGSYDRRSRPADYEMDPEIVASANYGPRMMEAMTSIPSVSLTLDPDDLWNSSNGIYPNSIMRASSNPMWEKPASMELIDPAGVEEGFCVNAGARIMGELARWPAVNDKQSFRIVFQAEYGATKLEYDLFGDSGVDKFDTLVLRANWGDGWLRDATRGTDLGISWLHDGPEHSLLFRDMFLHQSHRDTGHVGVRGRHVHLYLNGVYWGLYELIERPDNSFGAEHFGGSKDEYDVIKGTLADVSRNGTLQDGSKTAWNTMFYQFFDTTSAGQNIDGQVTPITDADLAQIEQYIDLDQYIDYMILLWTYNRQDFPRKNWYAFCRRNPAGGPPLIPFTFYTWDSEASVGQGVDDGSLVPQSREVVDRWNNTDSGNDTGPVRIYRRLITNATFRARWADRAQVLMGTGGPLDPANSIARFTAQADAIDTAIIGETARWGDSSFEWNEREGDPVGAVTAMTRDVDWVAERDRIVNDYLPTRTGYALDQMQEPEIGLYPSIDPPEFTQNGGEFEPGAYVYMTNPNGFGVVWYTTDGTDPRESSTAVPLSGLIPLTDSVLIRARVNASGIWSALVEAGFMPAGGPALAVSEIMYHPVDSDSALYTAEDYEFIEIHNTGEAAVNLRAIALIDGVQFDFRGGYLEEIPAGGYAVVVKNLAAFAERYPTGVLFAGTYEGSLDNDGETITMTAAGIPFTSFTYRDADNWPGRADGRGASLERKDFAIDPNDDDAWRSSSEYLGTPGYAGTGPVVDVVVNEVLSHTDLEPTDSIELFNASDVSVDIGGWYLSDSWDNYKKFRIPDGTVLAAGAYVVFDEHDFNVSGLNADPADDAPTDFGLSGAHGDDVWLMQADAEDNLLRFADHVEFGAAFNGESFGRWPNGAGELYPMESLTLGADNSGPRLGSVVISEVMYNPGAAELDDREFVEIHNAGGAAVDLTGWRLRGGVDYDFAAGLTLPAGARLVVLSFNPTKPENAARVADFQGAYGIDGSVWLVGGWDGKLDDAGERVELQQPDTPPVEEPYFTPHIVADQIDYDDLAPWPSSADGAGDSLHRLGTAWGGDPANWTAAAPSPGSGVDVLPGDADGDGAVNINDFVILKNNFGASGVSQAEGDFDGDGDVDINDFVVLKNNFGSTLP